MAGPARAAEGVPIVSKLVRFLGNNVVGLLALFVALGGTAYAVNTVGSTDIIDGEVKSVDIGNNEIGSSDVKDNSINTFDVHSFLGVDVVDGTLTGDDVADTSSLGPQEIREEFLTFNDTLVDSDLATGSVGSDEVDDNSLTGADINEATLALPSTATPVGFRAAADVALSDANQPTQVINLNVPQGNYTVAATATFSGVSFNGGGPAIRSVDCRIRSGGVDTGSITRDRRPVPVNDFVERSLSLNGIASAPAGGGDVTLLCASMTADEFIDDAQMVVTRVGSFF